MQISIDMRIFRMQNTIQNHLRNNYTNEYLIVVCECAEQKPISK